MPAIYDRTLINYYMTNTIVIWIWFFLVLVVNQRRRIILVDIDLYGRLGRFHGLCLRSRYLGVFVFGAMFFRYLVVGWGRNSHGSDLLSSNDQV